MHNSRNVILIFFLTQATILLLFNSNIGWNSASTADQEISQYDSTVQLKHLWHSKQKPSIPLYSMAVYSQSLNKGPENKLLAWSLHQWFNIVLFFISLSLNSFMEEWHFYEEMTELKVYL